MNITVIIIINIDIKFLIDWITIHLGKNPKKGGRPPKDKSEINILNFIKGKLLKNENIWLKWKKLYKLKIKINVKDK